MKHFKSVILTLSIPMLLTGCFSSSISKDKYISKIDSAETMVNVDSPKIDDVNIHDKLSIELYNYKVGEFYSFRYFALALIVPISYGTYTWKENGKYYHAKKELTKDLVTTEITEQQFNEYMESHRVTISEKLKEPLRNVKSIIDGNSEVYTLKTAKYTSSMFSKDYKATLNSVYYEYDSASDSQVEREMVHTLTINNNLPKSYTSKEKKDGGSDNKWTYSYGKAKFTNPNGDSSSENQ